MKKGRTKSAQSRHWTDSIDAFRTWLGPIASDYTDPQLRQLRSELRITANLLLNFYLEKQDQETVEDTITF